MQIVDMSVDLLAVPLEQAVQTGRFTIPAAHVVVVRLRSDEGAEGIGYGIVLRSSYGPALASLTASLQETVVGSSDTAPHALWSRVAQHLYKAGPEGMATWALSAVDIAAWDLLGKLAGLPLFRLLGGDRPSLPAYSLVGLTHEDEAGLFRDADRLIEQGAGALKVFVNGLRGEGGMRAIRDKLARLCQHVGPTIRVGIDNQESWLPPDALRFGHLIDDLELFWFEEPVPHLNFSAIGAVADTLMTPVCSGEQLYGLESIRSLIAQGRVDVAMADLRMIGGVTPFVKAAALAEAEGCQIANHMMTAVDVHLLAAVGNPALAEYVPWTDAIFEEPIVLRSGFLVVPETPGIGCSLIEGVIDKYRV